MQNRRYKSLCSNNTYWQNGANFNDKHDWFTACFKTCRATLIVFQNFKSRGAKKCAKVLRLTQWENRTGCAYWPPIIVSIHLEIKVGTKVCKTGQPDRQKDNQNLWLWYLCLIWTFIPVLGGQGVGVRRLNPLSRHVFHE